MDVTRVQAVPNPSMLRKMIPMKQLKDFPVAQRRMFIVDGTFREHY